MKKYGMIFGSVILAIMILLTPGQNVKADDIYLMNYDKFDSAYLNIKNNLEEVKLFLEQYTDEYYYLIVFDEQSNIDLYIVKKYDTKIIMYVTNVGNSLFSYTIQNVGDGKNHSNLKVMGISIDSFESEFLQFKTKVENNNFDNSSTFYIKSYNINWDSVAKGIVYNTNMDFIVKDTDLYSFNINGNSYQPGDIIPTYYDYLMDSKGIDISYYMANDLNGNDIDVVTIDFAKIYNENYIYQYKTSHSDWIDITSNINDAVLEGYYYYLFNNYYNTTITARVLDSEENEITSKTLDIINLTEYSYNYYFNKKYSSLNYSKVEFDFNLTNDVDIELKVNSILDNIYGSSFSSPYIEYSYKKVSVDSSNNVTFNGNYKEIVYISDLSNNYYNYALCTNIKTDNFKNGDMYYTSIKLVVPFDGEVFQSINVELSSMVDFDIIEYTKEEYENNLTELDLTGKKGAMFVAKDITDTYNATFKVYGMYYIEIRDSLDSTYYNVEKVYTYGFYDYLREDSVAYNCSSSNIFNYSFGQDNPYRVIHFINTQNEEDTPSKVYYDETKFNVYVIENNSVYIVVKDPVTDVEFIFDYTKYENYSSSSVDIDYLMGLIEEFLDDNGSAVELVKEILKLFFASMPKQIYQALILILFVMFVCTVIMLVGWH